MVQNKSRHLQNEQSQENLFCPKEEGVTIYMPALWLLSLMVTHLPCQLWGIINIPLMREGRLGGTLHLPVPSKMSFCLCFTCLQA